MTGLHQFGDEGGALLVRRVRLVLETHVVDGDVRPAAGDLEWRARGERVLAVEVADDDPVGRKLLVEHDLEIVHRVAAVAQRDRNTGAQCGAGRATEQALLGGRHARAVGGGGHDARGATALHPGHDHALGDLLANRSANFSAGHGVGGFVCGVRK